jgi:hypothetical protein
MAQMIWDKDPRAAYYTNSPKVNILPSALLPVPIQRDHFKAVLSMAAYIAAVFVGSDIMVYKER